MSSLFQQHFSNLAQYCSGAIHGHQLSETQQVALTYVHKNLKVKYEKIFKSYVEMMYCAKLNFTGFLLKWLLENLILSVLTIYCS